MSSVIVPSSSVGICCRNSAAILNVCDEGKPHLQELNRRQAELLTAAADIADEMLAALRGARKAIAEFPQSMAYEITHLREIDAAIAKAEGRS